MGGAWDQRQRWQLGREREKGKGALSTLVSSHPLCHQKGSSSLLTSQHQSLAAAPGNQMGKVCRLLAGVLVSYPWSKTNAALVTGNFPAFSAQPVTNAATKSCHCPRKDCPATSCPLPEGPVLACCGFPLLMLPASRAGEGRGRPWASRPWETASLLVAARRTAVGRVALSSRGRGGAGKSPLSPRGTGSHSPCTWAPGFASDSPILPECEEGLREPALLCSFPADTGPRSDKPRAPGQWPFQTEDGLRCLAPSGPGRGWPQLPERKVGSGSVPCTGAQAGNRTPI